jgi:hypothetical protein
MNGKVFLGLKKLKNVYLNRNVCVDKQFNGAAAIANLTREIPAACSFCALDDPIDDAIHDNSNKLVQVSSCKTEINAMRDQIFEAISNIKIELLNEKITKLDTDIKDCKANAKAWNDQIGILKETYEKLLAEKETIIGLKIDENSRLSAELTTANAENKKKSRF